MCIICAAIPATAAVGAKLNADQLSKPEEQRKPIPKITGIVMAVLVACPTFITTNGEVRIANWHKTIQQVFAGIFPQIDLRCLPLSSTLI